MNKVYTLPDLPSAPYSDAQALLRQFLEYRDFSALRPLLDELEALGEKDARRYIFNLCVCVTFEHWWDWEGFVRNVLNHTCHLLWSVEGVIEALGKRYWDVTHNTFVDVNVASAQQSWSTFTTEDNQ